MFINSLKTSNHIEVLNKKIIFYLIKVAQKPIAPTINKFLNAKNIKKLQ